MKDEKSICHRCVGEQQVSRSIRTDGKIRTCSYCGKRGRTETIQEVAAWVHGVFEEHYYRTSDEPNAFESRLINDADSIFDWERHGDPVEQVLSGLLEVDETIAEDLRAALQAEYDDTSYDDPSEGNYAEGSHYTERATDDSEWFAAWQNFEHTLREENRFFNPVVLDHLTKLFDGIEAHPTRAGRALISSAGPGTEFASFYRARVFQDEKPLTAALCRPDELLGTPPSAVAVGRMNAFGIAAFYGATSVDVAVAEVRPPVGCDVVVSRFEVIRPIKLLDLTVLESVYARGSLFDPTFSAKLSRSSFLSRLSELLIKPVMPEQEHRGYLVTQVIADFLSSLKKPELDGILFPSVQAKDGINAVLFQKASRVELLDIPLGTKIKASTSMATDDGEEREFWVSEEVPIRRRKVGRREDDWLAQPVIERVDSRSPTLRVDVKNIYVHRVTGVKFETDLLIVHRHRFRQRTWKFRGGRSGLSSDGPMKEPLDF